MLKIIFLGIKMKTQFGVGSFKNELGGSIFWFAYRRGRNMFL
jgi:hypothetical protein